MGGNLYTMEEWDKGLLSRDDLLLPFWQTEAPVLFIAGEDDRNCCAPAEAESAQKAAAANGKTNVEVLNVPVSKILFISIVSL